MTDDLHRRGRGGRIQVPEPLENLLHTHTRDYGAPLKEVSHPPRVGVLDQSDLTAQGIDVADIVPGATPGTDALGSCTANATTAKLSSFLPLTAFIGYLHQFSGCTIAPDTALTDVVNAEKAAIGFYHYCTDQTGDQSQEWPPTDCGSSGVYIVQALQKLDLVSHALIASGADNIVSLLQQGSLIVGQPFLYAWEEPASNGMVDGDGSSATLHEQLKEGVAGGHETELYAIEKLTLLPSGHVDPFNTILRLRNSWSGSWGDAGDYLIHLSTFVSFGGQCDFRLFVH
jgi:hypothetical protein